MEADITKATSATACVSDPSATLGNLDAGAVGCIDSKAAGKG